MLHLIQFNGFREYFSVAKPYTVNPLSDDILLQCKGSLIYIYSTENTIDLSVKSLVFYVLI